MSGRDGVVSQNSAASKELDQAGFKLVASNLTYWLTYRQDAARNVYNVDEVQKMFMRLA